jgi:hypothetical protein
MMLSFFVLYETYGGKSFEEFLLKVPRDRDTYSHLRAHCFWLRDLPRCHILQYGPDLQEQFDQVCLHLGIPHRELEHWNKGTRYYCTAAEMYERNPGTKELVEDIYWKDIQTFGQTFPY